MNRAAAITLALIAAAGLVACGGGGGTKDASTAAVPTVRTDPCKLVTDRDVGAVLGHTKATAVRAGPTCTYTAGARAVQVRVAAATAANRASLAHVPPSGRRLVGPEFRGYVVPVRAINAAQSGQAQLALIKGDTFLTIVLTDPGRSPRALVTRVGDLGLAAAERL